MNESDEELLQRGLIAPQEDFVRRTMARIAAAPLPRARPRRAMREIAQWIALAATTLLGAMQMASYMLGIWIISSAG
jgi:hypothetical protein